MRLQFNVQLTGLAADAVDAYTRDRGLDLNAFIANVLALGLADRLRGYSIRECDVTAGSHVVNEGGGGFHVVTVVNDGYGYLVAEDEQGKAQARVRATEHGASMDPTDDLAKLVRAWWAAVENVDR